MKLAITGFALFFILSCDHGIKPPDLPEQKTAISGTIFYTNWPVADSLQNLKLVIFKNFPPEDIVSEVIGGNAVAYPENLTENLPYNQDSTFYEMELEAGDYAYVVIAQQFGADVFNDWRAVGQYDTSPADSLPTAITVVQDSVLKNIDIYVDFKNLPIQPF
jgi:hypothetical protein